MIKRIFSISLIFSFIFALNIHAKEIENYDIDFKTAYELMMNNNNAIKALVEEVKVKKYKKNSALGQFAPKVVASADFVHFNNKTFFSAHNSSPMRQCCAEEFFLRHRPPSSSQSG